MNFSQLISALSNINEDLREQSIRAVNISLTMRNWFFGFYIVEFEQNGSDRASYGQALLTNISAAMKRHGIPNTDERQLRRYRQFYQIYAGAGALFTSNDSIRNLLPAKLLEANKTIPAPPIWQSPTPVFQNNDNQILNLVTNLSYTHFVELIQIEDPIKRFFYESECLKACWSVRELKRQIGSLLYERTGSPKLQKNTPKPIPAKIAENLLCTDKDQEHVEFATAGLDDKLFVSKYLVALPNKDQLQEFIKKELQNTLS